MARREAPTRPGPDFLVGGWLVQPSLNVVDQSGTVHHLEPQVMDLLAFLAATGGRVVSKDEIIDAVWQGRFIAEATLTRSIADLRRALGDNQRAPQFIETIPKRGYRLVAAVCAAPARDDSHDRAEPRRIADRLAAARRSRFVGRAEEVTTFRSALLAGELPFVVFHLNGPGGIGKTTLLYEFEQVARELGRPVLRIDGRNIEASPEGFLFGLAGAVGVRRVDMRAIVERWPTAAVLLVDTYELLASLDEWLRETLLPQLPAQTLVVIAGRSDPGPTWRTDGALASLTRLGTLANLAPDEGRAYLTRCGVPLEQHDEAMAFTRGHPLALSLIADMLARTNRPSSSRLGSESEIVRLLLEAFVRSVPSRDHRLALQACVTAWATTEGLLAAALDRPDVHELFEWLERLPFVEHGPYGLFPHDLARDVVFMDFRWRDPDATYRVTAQILSYLHQRLDRTQGLDQQRVWLDILFVQRYNARVRPYFEWAGFGTAYADAAGESELTAIAGMVERHEGRESAAIARYWQKRQPEAFRAIRKVTGELNGFVANFALDPITPEDAAADPAIAPAVRYAERHGPTRPGEVVVYSRFWMDAERYQTLTQVFTVVAAISSQAWIGRKVAWTFVAMADPDFIEPLFSEIHMYRVPEADFAVGARRFGVFAHDWRVESAEAWLRLKADRAFRAEGLVPATHP